MEKDLSSWPVKQLKDYLGDLSLPISGNKPELINRIQRAEAQYLKLNVKQLKEILGERKLLETGRKADLVKRLEEDDRKKALPPLTTRLDELLPELMATVLLDLSDKELINTCRISKRADKVCKDDLFWYARIKHVFGYDLIAYKETDLSYKKMYKFLKKCEKLKLTRTINGAITLKYLPILRYIIEEIKPDYDINNALLLAKDLKMFKYLMDNGANPFARIGNITPFSNLVDLNIVDIVRHIVNNLKPDKYNLNLALRTASSKGNLPMVKLMINLGATDIDIALEFVAPDGVLELVKYLIEEAGATSLNRTLLGASEYGNLDIVKYLVGAGASNLTDALTTAVRRDEYYIIEYLISKGADVQRGIDIAYDDEMLEYLEELR